MMINIVVKSKSIDVRKLDGGISLKNWCNGGSPISLTFKPIFVPIFDLIVH